MSPAPVQPGFLLQNSLLLDLRPTEPPGVSDVAQCDDVESIKPPELLECQKKVLEKNSPQGGDAKKSHRSGRKSVLSSATRSGAVDKGELQKATDKESKDKARRLKRLEESAKALESMMEEMKLEAASKKTSLLAAFSQSFAEPVVMGDEYVMIQRGHGTSNSPVQKNLRWGCDFEIADQICNFNRKAAEESGYLETTTFLEECSKLGDGEVMEFHDSNSGDLLFTAPKGRTLTEFIEESKSHGWPSFRDPEVNWSRVRVLGDGEAVSVNGTHLGHCFKDGGRGHRYCINLVSVAGRPKPRLGAPSIKLK
eukprot:TRINITY_DN109787_c0_g1_i1.p1 TRINITY_DN109787_c0_g1~~TRINITY_DN109787_c0_g1_i1.p1  ORF type:complete len:310 (+),score=66.85 TRINITY_DN109787_c0_g1_i1:78-1007(+)